MVATPSAPQLTLVPETQRRFAAGTRIGRYELISELGRGGMGIVFLARDLGLGRRVAIKLLTKLTDNAVEGFLTEVHATAACRHENIVVIHEAGVFEGTPFIVLEHLEGLSLDAYQQEQQLAPARVVELMVPVVRALTCAHDQGIVHRDLKMSNIMLTREGAVKVLDFGIAKLLDSASALRAEEARWQLLRGSRPVEAEVSWRQAPEATELEVDGGHGDEAPGLGAPGSTGDRLTEIDADERREGATDPAECASTTARESTRAPASRRSAPTHDSALSSVKGTVAYMAPEQFAGEVLDPRADIWAAGVVMFRLLTAYLPLPRDGKRSGPGEDLGARLRELAPEVPRRLRRVVERCLQWRRHDRYGNARELLAALEPLLPRYKGRSLEEGENPYRGLAAFEERDADRFCGRGRETRHLATLLQERPLVAVVGASGVGKSSLLHAGLVPFLHSSEPWEVLSLRPGRRPLAALAEALRGHLDVGPRDAAESLTGLELAAELRAQPHRLGQLLRRFGREQQTKVLLLVDQFEELYTLAPSAERRAFVAALLSAADHPRAPVRIALSLRIDLLDRVAEEPSFADELLRGLFLLSPLSAGQLEEALTSPLEALDHRIDREVVDDMLEVLSTTNGALPLLQFTAARLWQARDVEQRRIPWRAYEAIGGIVGALASHADEVVGALPGSRRRLARLLFARLVTPARTRAVVDLDDLVDIGDGREVRAVLEHLTRARLLVVREREERPTVEIIHEALIRAWPTLGRWLDAEQDDRAFFARLQLAATQWDEGGRSRGLLWRDETVDEARRWRRLTSHQLNRREEAFLRAVFALAEGAARRRRWVFASLFAAMAVVAAASFVVLLVLRQARGEAVTQARIAGQEAQRAKRAERQVLRQLQLLKQKEKQRTRASLQRRQALEQTRRANLRIKVVNAAVAASKETLARTNAMLRQALRRARRSGDEAKAQSKKAAASAAAAQEANSKLRRLLSKERAAMQKLKGELRKITTELR